MSDNTPQDSTTRYYLLEVKSEANLELASSFTQFNNQPVDALVALNFMVADDEDRTGVQMKMSELTGEDIGEFLHDFIDASEMNRIFDREFAATDESLNNDGLDIGDDEGDSDGTDDDTEFPDEDGDYALPR
jgi:hypothetical protein